MEKVCSINVHVQFLCRLDLKHFFLHLKHSFQYFETELSTSQRPNKWAGGSTFLSFKLGLSILEMLHVTFNIENVAFKVGNVQKNAFPALKATFQILKVSISNLKARE